MKIGHGLSQIWASLGSKDPSLAKILVKGAHSSYEVYLLYELTSTCQYSLEILTSSIWMLCGGSFIDYVLMGPLLTCKRNPVDWFNKS